MVSDTPVPGVPITPGSAAKKGNGSTLICVTDPTGCIVSLDVHRWEDHIVKGHPEVNSLLELVKSTAEQPELIQRSATRLSTYYYYRLAGRKLLNSNDLYMSLVVDRNDVTNSGSIRTAHLVPKLRSEGETIWMNRKI